MGPGILSFVSRVTRLFSTKVYPPPGVYVSDTRAFKISILDSFADCVCSGTPSFDSITSGIPDSYPMASGIPDPDHKVSGFPDLDLSIPGSYSKSGIPAPIPEVVQH